MALTNDATTFVTGVSQRTGIDPRVLVAWVQAEDVLYATTGSNPQGTGHYNYLNLRPYPGDPYSGVSSGNFEQFANVQNAIAATVRRLQQPFARPIIAAAAARANPQQQIQAIASTGWDSGHYGGSGGIKLQQIFASIFTSAGLTSPYQGPATAGAVASTAGTVSAADKGSVSLTENPVADAVKSATDQIKSISEFLGKLTDPAFLIRAGEVIAGAVLILYGLRILASQVGLPAPSVPGPVSAAAGAVS